MADKMSAALSFFYLRRNPYGPQNTTSLLFTEGPILKPLLQFAAPVLFALLLQAMYGGTDLLIVGQFASAADVSAVSTGSQVMQSATSVVTGLAMGITILLGQKIGQKRKQAAVAL